MKALALLLLCLSACAIPVSGTRCDAGVAYCSSATAALSCQGGTLMPYACMGPKGCVLGAGRAVLCDQSQGATAGAPCFPEYEGHGQCAKDGTGYFLCMKGSWVQLACNVGTSCHEDGGVACR